MDIYRIDASQRLDPEQRSKMGQFFTPPPVAEFMASLFGETPDVIRLLDAGAGVGSLIAAFIEDTYQRDRKPHKIEVTAYEIDPVLTEYLQATLFDCEDTCQEIRIEFIREILETDFIQTGADMLWGGLFSTERQSFNRVILNPPYKKNKERFAVSSPA